MSLNLTLPCCSLVKWALLTPGQGPSSSHRLCEHEKERNNLRELCSGGPKIISSETQRSRVTKLSAQMNGQQIL